MRKNNHPTRTTFEGLRADHHEAGTVHCSLVQQALELWNDSVDFQLSSVELLYWQALLDTNMGSEKKSEGDIFIKVSLLIAIGTHSPIYYPSVHVQELYSYSQLSRKTSFSFLPEVCLSLVQGPDSIFTESKRTVTEHCYK